LYFNLFSAYFCTTFLSAGIATSISVHVFSFLLILIIIIIIGQNIFCWVLFRNWPIRCICGEIYKGLYSITGDANLSFALIPQTCIQNKCNCPAAGPRDWDKLQKNHAVI
jgi:hypothetical protein